jgi:hypothetical protein
VRIGEQMTVSFNPEPTATASMVHRGSTPPHACASGGSFNPEPTATASAGNGRFVPLPAFVTRTRVPGAGLNEGAADTPTAIDSPVLNGSYRVLNRFGRSS